MFRRSCLCLLITTGFFCGVTVLADPPAVIGGNTINLCETKTYTIVIPNTSGNTLADLAVRLDLTSLGEAGYVSGSTSIWVEGSAPFCTADPTGPGSILTWDIDSLCSTTFNLTDGQTLNLGFSLRTGCLATSGSMNVHLEYTEGGTPVSDDTAYSIQVLPGAVSVKLTPGIIPQAIGQDVTWTITVENTGLGTIRNVVVTDVLGAGLVYAGSSPAGSQAGQTITWDAGQEPQLASLDPGDRVLVNITARVNGCSALETTADARWGCDMATGCFDTASDGGTATASVQRIARSPLLDYTPPDVSFTYCSDLENASFTIANTGDGQAHEAWLIVDFGPMAVSNVSAGAIYNAPEHRFELADPIPPGGTYDLSFSVNYSTWCGGGFPAGELLWQSQYEGECHETYYAPVRVSTVNALSGTTSLTLTKAGGGEAIQIGDQVIYNIASSYVGPLSCGSGGSVSDITVVDTVPDGFTVVDAGGGTWVPGGGGTGGTITWTYTPPASLNTNITLQSPDRTQCEIYCFTTFTNTVSASGADCCGCAMNATASRTSAIECEEFVNSNKTADPVPQERCGTIQYTNTYDFGSAGILLNALKFKEYAENQQQYVPGSLTVTYDGADITGCVLVTDTTPGGNLSLDFSGCAAGMVNNKNLTIVYRLTITEATVAACGGTTFYSWSGLNMGTIGSECLQDGEIMETVAVTVQPPAMAVSIAGLEQIVDKCQTHTITLTLTRTSDVAGTKDVRLVLSGLNYYVVAPTATSCSGAVAPTSCTPARVGDDYVWYFGDGFTGSGQNAVIQLDVCKRCTGGGDLTATAYYDDRCNDDGTYDDTCSATATETPIVLRSGDLSVEMTPDVYHATTSTLEWKIYVTNQGSGTAHLVWVDDVLGAGLDYQSAVVDDMTGVTVTADEDHDGTAINGCTISISDMTPGERRVITVTALLIGCDDLINNATTSWGCAGHDCQTPASASATVQISQPTITSASVVTSPADACSDPHGTLTLRNAGQIACYNLQITAALPTGLTFVSGSTRWRANGGVWNGPDAAYDPNPAVSPIRWTATEIPGLAVLEPGDSIEIEYDLHASCLFTGGAVALSTQYENPCGQVFTTDSTFPVAFRAPHITLAKTRADEPIDCGQLVEWTITVQNTSGYTLPIIWVEDTLDAAFTFSSAEGDPLFTSDNGTFDGVNKVSWELQDVHHNDTVSLTLRATSDTFPCSPDLDNTVRAWWGCGDADGSSGTKPGADPPDLNLCLGGTPVSFVRTETRQPAITRLNAELLPAAVNACTDSIQATLILANTGGTDAANLDVVVTLPDALWYQADTAALFVGTDDTGVPVPIQNPVSVGNQLIFTNIASTADNLANLLQADGGNDTLVLRFMVDADCYATADVHFDVRYYDCCGLTQYTSGCQATLPAAGPALMISQAPAASQIDCGAQQSWNITVTNTGNGDAPVVRIEDTPGGWITVDMGASSAGLADMGSGVFGWEFNNLAAGASQSFQLTGTLNPAGNDCTATLRQNNARAVWGCGTSGDAVDGNPTTTGYDCTSDTWANAPAASLPLPNLVTGAVTPSAACSSDGAFTGNITVQVGNTGDGNTGSSFVIQAADGKGWTGTYTYTGTIAAGGTANIVIPGSSWAPAWVPTCTTCSPASPYSFTVMVDQGNNICECDESDNTSAGATLNVYRPELTVTDIDFSSVTCSGDHISGSIQVRVDNTGCSNATNAVVSLSSDCGLTFGNRTVNVTAGSNATATFTIGSGNWTSCTSGTCGFTASVDPSGAICECAGSSHGLTETLPAGYRLPDLNAVAVVAASTCSGDGSLSGTISVTVSNIGPVAVNGDFFILVNDGRGWAAELLYNADLGGTLPLSPGDSSTVTFNWSRSFTATPYVCAFPAITATVDSRDDVCECTGTNNQAAGSYTLAAPNLRLLSLSPACLGDGSFSIEVVVGNNGCGTANSVPVQLADNAGNAQTQTVSLSPGAQATLTFAPWLAAGASIFSANADPGGLSCELDGTDNTMTAGLSLPNLRLVSLTPVCVADAAYLVTLVVGNDGAAAVNSDFMISLTDDAGQSRDVPFTSLGGTLPFNTGTQQTVTFSGWTVGLSPTTLNFTGLVDSGGAICESDSTDNSGSASLVINNLAAAAVTAATSCSADGAVTGTLAVTVANNGGQAINGDFFVHVDDGQGWTSELLYNADLGGTLPLAAGGAGAVTFDWTRNFTAVPLVCAFPAITATVDSRQGLCEWSTADNQAGTSYTLPLPDLRLDSVTPLVTCAGDGLWSGMVTVTVSNPGCATAAVAVVRLVSDCGFTFADQAVTLGAGASASLMFPFTPNAAVCSCAFTATADPDGLIGEADGSNNARSSGAFSMSIPDLTITAVDFSGITCADDRVSGNVGVTVRNQGCGTASNFLVSLATDGCLTFTSQAVASLVPGASTVLDFGISGAWADCAGGSCLFTATADSGGTVCEADGTNNSLAQTYQNTLPDLTIGNIDFSGILWANDGISGSIQVSVVNQGFAAAANFQVSLATDGCLTFPAQTVASLAAGATTMLTFTIGGAWADCSACSCAFTATADPADAVCECSGANNSLTTSYSPGLPNLVMESLTVTPACVTDGNFTGFGVRVANRGCSAAAGAVVRLSTGCGWAFTDQTISLAAGESRDVSFPLAAGQISCSCDFTASIDPADLILECTGADNGQSSSAPLAVPDIAVSAENLQLACLADGTVTVTGSVTLRNNGCGSALTANIPLHLSVYDHTGGTGSPVDQWTALLTAVNLPAAGGTQVFPLQPHSFQDPDFYLNAVGCQSSVLLEADPGGVICEWDGTNNSLTADKCADNPCPVLTALAPTTVLHGSPAFSLAVTGQGFVPASVVHWNGTGLPTTFQDGQHLLASVSAALAAVPGPVAVSVYSPAPGGCESNALTFQVDDGDGVPPEVEDAGPNGGDGNADGVPDSRQPAVATLLRPDGGWLTVELTGECPQLQSVRTLDAAAASGGSPEPYFDYPFGMVEFTAPCASAEVTLLFHGSALAGGMVYHCYGQFPPYLRGPSEWFAIPADFGAASGAMTVRFTLADNQTGDVEASAGLIRNVGGPAVPGQPIPGLGDAGRLALLLLLALAGVLLLAVRAKSFS